MRGRLRQLAWRIGDEPVLAALLVSQHSSLHFEDISHWFCWNLVLSACFILLCETIFTQFSCRKPQKHMKTSDQTPGPKDWMPLTKQMEPRRDDFEEHPEQVRLRPDRNDEPRCRELKTSSKSRTTAHYDVVLRRTS